MCKCTHLPARHPGSQLSASCPSQYNPHWLLLHACSFYNPKRMQNTPTSSPAARGPSSSASCFSRCE